MFKTGLAEALIFNVNFMFFQLGNRVIHSTLPCNILFDFLWRFILHHDKVYASLSRKRYDFSGFVKPYGIDTNSNITSTCILGYMNELIHQLVSLYDITLPHLFFF